MLGLATDERNGGDSCPPIVRTKPMRKNKSRGTKLIELFAFCICIVAVCVLIGCKSKPSKPVDPPVNLNENVTNPDLVAAMDALSKSASDKNLDALITELCKANFLAAAVDGMPVSERSDREGQATLKKGANIALMMVELEDGQDALCLFTDWDEIAKHTDRQVSGLVLPSWQAWKLVLKNDQLAIVNPSGSALPLDREQIMDLAKMSEAFKPD